MTYDGIIRESWEDRAASLVETDTGEATELEQRCQYLTETAFFVCDLCGKHVELKWGQHKSTWGYRKNGYVFCGIKCYNEFCNKPKVRMIRWMPREDQMLLNLRAQGLTWTEIGERMNRRPKSCRDRWLRLEQYAEQ